MGPHLDQLSNRESNALGEVNEVFTVLVFAGASVGLDPPPPKKLLMSDGMAGASNRFKIHRRLMLGASLIQLVGRSPNVLLQFNSGNLSHEIRDAPQIPRRGDAHGKT